MKNKKLEIKKEIILQKNIVLLFLEGQAILPAPRKKKIKISKI